MTSAELLRVFDYRFQSEFRARDAYIQLRIPPALAIDLFPAQTFHRSCIVGLYTPINYKKRQCPDESRASDRDFVISTSGLMLSATPSGKVIVS
jgi:hypothetical protein